ncbi:MAG TPA: glycosyltransferase [Candidatus Saccharimonadales bacterium]
MKIGLFTDTYLPSINGIVYVVASTKRHLESLGHEVYIFCPARSIRPTKHAETYDEDEHVIRFSSVKGAFYDDYDTSLFFPPRVLKQVRELDLDVIHFFTPGQIGLMGVFAAIRTETPLVAQHCTDLREYVEHYRDGLLLPGILALVALLPFTVRVDGKDLREIMRIYRPRRGRVEWNIDIVKRMVTLVYSKCDAVIALSRKSKQQLESWQNSDNYRYEVTLKPDGVTPLPASTKTQQAEFRKQHGIAAKDKIVLFVGRLGAEKNLALLIPMIEQVAAAHPDARLVFVGDNEYRATLETLANESIARGRITFTGSMPREELGRVFETSSVFVFPSLTDTQAWVLHEAAQSGLPVVMIDPDLSEVVLDGENGYIVDNDVADFAHAVGELLGDKTLQSRFSKRSRELAAEFTEEGQIAKLVKIYDHTTSRL